MDLLPASSLLSPLSPTLICTETQFHLTEPAFLPVLIYGPDRDWREPEREGGGGSGGLRERGESGGGSSLGALSSTACCPGWAGWLSSWEKLGGCSPLSWSSQTLWPVHRNNNTNQRKWPSMGL